MNRIPTFSLLFLALLLMASVTPARAIEATSPATATTDGSQPAVADPPIAKLIDELNSNRYLVREQASQALLAAGSAALDPLLEAANGDQPEPADRAVWVLKKLGESKDRAIALAALDRLVQVKKRPAVVRDAALARARMYETACQEALAKLGARMIVVDSVVAEHGPIRLVTIELTDDWHGGLNDLACLAELRDHRFFKMEGQKVGDAEIKLFENMDELVLLQIWKTQVTPAAVDAIKANQPQATVYVRNRALLGIGGATHEKGVLVTDARANMGAAAGGILAGDVVTSLDGEPVKDFDRLTARIAQYQPGDKIKVSLLRGDEKLTKTVTLSDWSMYE